MSTISARTPIAAILALAASTAMAAVGGSGGPPGLAKQILAVRGAGTIKVRSDALTPGEPIHERFTQSGEDQSPPISWDRGPTGTRTYALLIEDASVAGGAGPVAHWVVYDIPFAVSRLAANQPKSPKLDMGALQGHNIISEPGYVGPKLPLGQTHNYHIEVFALNTQLNLDPAATGRDDVVQAMKGHVLAVGDLIVNYTGK
jgi:Raf kinase inhibitor-like YbhB/YbcL family protein